ncbi:Long chain acyl-CoA synthetase 6, peroxisomal [Orobanche gracilis]
MDDLAALRPTIFSSVPRLYNRIYAGITNAVKTSGVMKERLFNVAYNSKKQAIISGRKPSPMWDRLVFNKIKDKLGGRVRYLTSGASPLSPDIMEFLRVCFGCQMIEGYGMTETSCVISSMDEGDFLTGHVGSPNPACEIKLVDVPEMNYTSEDQPHPRGEICVRGPIVFQGYYKDEVQTREVMDDEGWLHTGDIGLWLPGGRLKIIDRKKNIFKLAQGEYIAPEKIENVYGKCKFVAQCFVYGDSLNSCLVAVVCVEPDVLKNWAASEGIKIMRHSPEFEPEWVIHDRWVSREDGRVHEFLVQWEGKSIDDATCVGADEMKRHIPNFRLDDKAVWKEGGVVTDVVLSAWASRLGHINKGVIPESVFMFLEYDFLVSALALGRDLNGASYKDLVQLCADPRARAAVLADMDAAGKEAQLRGFEFAKAVTLVAEPFTVENGLLTPTFKVKRPQAKAYFSQAISHMYAELSTFDQTPQKLL